MMKFDQYNNQQNNNLEQLISIPIESKNYLIKNPDLYQAFDLGLI